jgi:hypothetical protein
MSPRAASKTSPAAPEQHKMKIPCPENAMRAPTSLATPLLTASAQGVALVTTPSWFPVAFFFLLHKDSMYYLEFNDMIFEVLVVQSTCACVSSLRMSFDWLGSTWPGS